MTSTDIKVPSMSLLSRGNHALFGLVRQVNHHAVLLIPSPVQEIQSTNSCRFCLYTLTCAICILSSTFLPHRPHLRGPENERETSFKDELISRATELVKAHGNASPWCVRTMVVAGSVYFLMKRRKNWLSRRAQTYCPKLITCCLTISGLAAVDMNNL